MYKRGAENEMKKSIVLLLSLVLCFSVVLTVFVIASDKSEPPCTESGIIYITDKSAVDFNAEEFSVETVGKSEILLLKPEEIDNILIDLDLLDDDVRGYLLAAFAEGKKIIVRGDISRGEIKAYFSLENNEYPAEELSEKADEAAQPGTLVNVSTYCSAGKLIYQDIRGANITNIVVEDSGNGEKVMETFRYCFGYDYLELSTRETLSDAERGMRYSICDWTNVDTATATYSFTRVMINTSIRVYSDDDNPNADGENLQYVPYIVEINPCDWCVVDYAEIEVKGGRGSLIYNYGPTEQTCGASGTVAFSMPPYIAVSFTPCSGVTISKISGGIDSRNLKLGYNAVNILGIDWYTFDSVRCEAHIESYQPSSFYYGYGAFHVLTYEADFVYGNTWNPITYYNIPGDTAY